MNLIFKPKIARRYVHARFINFCRVCKSQKLRIRNGTLDKVRTSCPDINAAIYTYGERIIKDIN